MRSVKGIGPGFQVDTPGTCQGVNADLGDSYSLESPGFATSTLPKRSVDNLFQVAATLQTGESVGRPGDKQGGSLGGDLKVQAGSGAREWENYSPFSRAVTGFGTRVQDNMHERQSSGAESCASREKEMFSQSWQAASDGAGGQSLRSQFQYASKQKLAN